MCTIRNIVLVTLLQIGVVVIGVPAAGLARKAGVLAIPSLTAWLITYGVALLAIPLAWGILLSWLHQRPGLPEEMKSLAFLSGIVVLLALCAFIGYAVVVPWFNFPHSMPDEG